MFAFVKSARGVTLTCAGLLILLSGCGIGEYNRLMKHRFGALRAEAKFKGLYAPTQIANTPISIRIPAIYANSYQADSPHNDDGPVIDPDRVQPPFLKLPGFKLCYEGMASAGGAKLPHYCYLAVEPSTPGSVDKIADQLQTQLKEAFPDATDSWRPIDVVTPTGFNIHWRKLRVEAEQPFRVKAGQKVDVQMLPGIFEVWLRDADNYAVIVAWRAPKSVDGPPAAEPATVSDLPFVVPTDGKPDLTNMPPLTAGTVTNDSAKDAEE